MKHFRARMSLHRYQFGSRSCWASSWIGSSLRDFRNSSYDWRKHVGTHYFRSRFHRNYRRDKVSCSENWNVCFHFLLQIPHFGSSLHWNRRHQDYHFEGMVCVETSQFLEHWPLLQYGSCSTTTWCHLSFPPSHCHVPEIAFFIQSILSTPAVHYL